MMASEVLAEIEGEGLDLFLVICDWVMPGLNGDLFLEQVHEKYPGVQTIMITGQADSDSIRKVQMNKNVLAVLRKPWRSSELAEIIRKKMKNENIGEIAP